jgi:hypothetical protein
MIEERLTVSILSINDEQKQTELYGNTLRVYWYVLRNKQNCGVREVQRSLGFSSSSTAHYHLEKLADKGMLIKDAYGNYRINNNARTRTIGPFILIHGAVFPEQLLYALVTTTMCVIFLMIFWRSLTLTVIAALSPGILASGIFWYESVRLWLGLPSFKGSVRQV